MKKVIISMLALALTGSAMSQDFVNTLKLRSINTSGTAEMEIVPDEIYVQVELREYDKKNEGKVDIESIKNNFIKACLSIGIPDSNISVQGYQGWDGNYWWYKKNKKKNPDMKASITYWVKLGNTKKMDELVNKMDDEATQNFSIAKVSHSKEKEFKKQLKIQAVKAAKEKAIMLAEAIGENVGQAITINEPAEMGIFPMYANTMMRKSVQNEAADDAGPEANIDFKKINYKFEVNVTFALK